MRRRHDALAHVLSLFLEEDLLEEATVAVTRAVGIDPTCDVCGGDGTIIGCVHEPANLKTGETHCGLLQTWDCPNPSCEGGSDWKTAAALLANIAAEAGWDVTITEDGLHIRPPQQVTVPQT